MEAFRPVTLLLVACGSAVGGLLRHGLTEGVVRVSGGHGPLATLAINVVGSAAAGMVVGMAGRGWPVGWPPAARYAVMGGLLGGFTTFSAFSVQTLGLVHEGRWAMAALYVMASTTLAIVGCALGFTMTSAAR